MEPTMTLLAGAFDFATRLTTWRMRDERGNAWSATGSAFKFEGINRVKAVFELDRFDSPTEVAPERLDVPRAGIHAPDAVWRREGN